MPKILIVEDDLDLAHILKDCLEESPGYKVLDLLTNEEAVYDWMAAHDTAELDCALLDLSIPKSSLLKTAQSRNGLSLIEKFRKDPAFQGKILVLTNSRMMEDGNRALQAGCDGYLCKHAAIDEISSMIDELKLAIGGELMVISRQMRHVFLRDELSGKEARLMDLLSAGHSWAEIALDLGYKNANAACVVGSRVFAKVLAGSEYFSGAQELESKRDKALERWRVRYRGQAKRSTTAF
ncbi:MAG: response regulator [Candidatus Obscuribacterales bacterium]|nr:response regulator [Candidatus Obscuribacterales bacterium]